MAHAAHVKWEVLEADPRAEFGAVGKILKAPSNCIDEFEVVAEQEVIGILVMSKKYGYSRWRTLTSMLVLLSDGQFACVDIISWRCNTSFCVYYWKYSR